MEVLFREKSGLKMFLFSKWYSLKFIFISSFLRQFWLVYFFDEHDPGIFELFFEEFVILEFFDHFFDYLQVNMLCS